MAIPDFQTLMLPLLKLLADKREYAMREVTDTLSDQFGLTEEERNVASTVSGQGVMYNRTAWAKTYLKRAGLVEQPKRGLFKISEKGFRALQTKPTAINLKFLEQFGDGLNLKEYATEQTQFTSQELPTQTPEELIESGAKVIRKDLAEEILSRIKGCSPVFFERLVVELLVKMGYGGSRQDAGRAIGRSGDEGIDGVIHEDRLGLDVIYLQAKRWEGVVGRPEIQKFVGALQGQRAKKGVFITTSDFTKEAVEYVRNIDNKVVLINGALLANLMIDHNVGVSLAATYEIKKIDSDYFLED
ncbi:MAG: restriction endonuclease [Gallionella sp.]|nr:restriction endonuclease [Gallionella sp.]MDD4946368.1 restriction endonuclease [Gallionella sp.]MDD5611724.1 restriction endonuclease [Gallionella sp.]